MMNRLLRLGVTVLLLSITMSIAAAQEAGWQQAIRGTQSASRAEAPAKKAAPAAAQGGNYVVLAWNDLGMHCISPRFAEMAILPPYNNLMAVVIRRAGEEPNIISSGITLTYSLDNNTKVTGKTDFWQYAFPLFGKKLAPGIGLTGLGLSGSMTPSSGHFQAVGIPALPFTDNLKWNPLQKATIRVFDRNKKVIATASATVPVSDEMDCAKCHATGQAGAQNISTPTVEGNILTLHDRTQGTTLMKSRPVLCASCHSDNALGTPGTPGVQSLSLAMHGKHASVANPPACYDCHPGAKTQCVRSAIPAMGPDKGDPGCDRCHGNLAQVANSIVAGRRPWIDEPTCAQCHGKAYDTGKGVLYRNARGHGNVPCAACHNSPHAWYPSLKAQDNSQPLTLQGNSKAIGYKGCKICHTDGRTGTMPPHGED